jgi:hypothetical protein
MANTEGPLFPFGEAIAADQTRLVTPRWRRWFLNLRSAVDLSQRSIVVPPQTDQSATLPVTDMDNGALSAGLYSVSWYLAVTIADGVSSSAQVAIAWVDNGNNKSYTGAAMTGNTTSTVQVNEAITIYSDAASPITYSVTYASNTPGQMHYDFRPVLQSVSLS